MWSDITAIYIWVNICAAIGNNKILIANVLEIDFILLFLVKADNTKQLLSAHGSSKIFFPSLSKDHLSNTYASWLSQYFHVIKEKWRDLWDR